MSIHRPYVMSAYLYEPLKMDGINPIVRRCVKRIKASGIEFDAIAFRGMSGAVIAPVLAAKLKKGLIAVRKSDENTHSYVKVEGLRDARYLIVDDFVDSGHTIKTIIKEIKEWDNGKGVCVGLLLYNGAGSSVSLAFPDLVVINGAEWVPGDGSIPVGWRSAFYYVPKVKKSIRKRLAKKLEDKYLTNSASHT